MQHDDDRAGRPRPSASLEDLRRWGYDPDEDRHARGIAQDERQFGGDRGWGGYGGLGRHDDGEPRIDAEREPGRAQHLAFGEGGAGDWTASAAGSGYRRAAGAAYGGWPAAGSMQARGWGGGPRGDDVGGGTGSAPTVRRPGPKGWQRSDARIHDDVCVRLSRSGLDAGDLSVEVRDGQVTLAGTVADRPTKHAIESLVDACHGVREIDNRIKVMRPEPSREGPPRPRASVPPDSPTARDEARGRTTRLPRDGSGYYG